MDLRILGIDPGLATVGFGVVDTAKNAMKLVSCGVISTPAHTSLSSRLDRIFSDMNELIQTFNPDVISVEELFFNTNITTGIAVSHARGVILLSAYRSGVPVYEYTPLQVKQAVEGGKTAGHRHGKALAKAAGSTEAGRRRRRRRTGGLSRKMLDLTACRKGRK